MDVTETTFQADVIERSRELPVVVDFWAEWCGPCRMLGPVLEREVEAREGDLVLAKVDVDANPAVASEYGIRGIPAVKAFRNGRVVDEFVGVRSPQGVAEFLDSLVGPSEAERMIEELRIEGEWADVVEALEAGYYDGAFDLLLARAERGDASCRERVRKLMVALFADLGAEHPLAQRYRRRLASVLF